LRLELMAAHKAVYRGGTVNQFLGIVGDRLPIVVTIPEPSRRRLKLADELIDVLLSRRAIQPGLNERPAKAAAKDPCASLDALKDWPYLPVTGASRAPLGVHS
jgi:hypothetical protein